MFCNPRVTCLGSLPFKEKLKEERTGERKEEEKSVKNSFLPSFNL